MTSPYCTKQDVLDLTQLTENEDGMTEDFINSVIEYASKYIDEVLNNPSKVRREVHYFDGDKRYIDLDNTGGVEEITRLLYEGSDSLLPLPDNGYNYMEDETEWGYNNASIIADTSDYLCGTQSLVVSSNTASTIYYPDDKNIGQEWYGSFDKYSYICFWLKTSDDILSSTFTFKFALDSSNYYSYTFELEDFDCTKGEWTFISLPIADFSLTGTLNKNKAVKYIELSLDTAGEYKIDGLQLCDYFAILLPEGRIYFVDYDDLPSFGSVLKVNYSYDRFKTTPDDIKLACAAYAASILFESLESRRFKNTASKIMVTRSGMVQKDDLFTGLGVRAKYWKQWGDRIIKSRDKNNVIILGESNDYDLK